MIERLEGRVLLASELFFAATTGTNGTELWSYTGTGSPVRRSDVQLGSASGAPQELTAYNGRIYFSANDGSFGRELYTFNGSQTVRVADINTGFGSSNPEQLQVLNGLLYFSADDGVRGEELWVYNSATNQATLAADINTSPGPSGTASAGSLPFNMTVWNNKLYFSARGTGSDSELWVYDPATLAATRVADIRPGASGSSPSNLVVFQNQLYFEANDGSTYGSELFRYNGSAVSLAADINPGSGSSFVGETAVFNNKLYFAANRGDTGSELFSFDGTSASLVADLYPGHNGFEFVGSQPQDFVLFNDRLFFTANRGNGTELWSYNGASTPTVVDEAFTTPGFGTNVIDPAVFNGQLYFGVSSAVEDGELYRYSGSGSIQLVANLYPGSTPAAGYPNGSIPNGSNPSTLAVVDSTNFAPVISDVPNQAIAVSGSKTVNFTVSDTETPAASLSVTVTSSNATLFLPGSMVLGGSGGNRTLTLTPTAGMTGVSAVITLNVTDTGNLTATDTFEVFVGPINNAPVLDTSGAPALDPITEDPTANPGTSVADLISRLGGTKITDTEGLANIGIAVTAVDQANGAWQYTLNNGAQWLPFTGGAAEGFARLLPSDGANARVRFVPNAHFNGTLDPAIAFRAWDRSSGTAGSTADTRTPGGGSAYSVNIETASLAVTSVNDTPDAVDDIANTDKLLTRVINVKANDTDADLELFNVDRLNGAAIAAGNVVTLPSGAKVTFNANQTFTYDPNGAFGGLANNATATDTFTYRVSDAAGANDTATVTVTVTNVQIFLNTRNDIVDSDAGTTSLREAIISANAVNTDATITLMIGTHNLTRTGSLENVASTGDLDITDTYGRLKIVGTGRATSDIHAWTLNDRVFHVATGSSLDLRGVTVREGTARDTGTAVIEAQGGGILNFGTLNLSDVAVSDNRAIGDAGTPGLDGYIGDGPAGSGQIQAPTNGLNGRRALGGGIYSNGPVTADNVVIGSNTAVGGAGGRGGTPIIRADGNMPGDYRSRGANGADGERAQGGGLYIRSAVANFTNASFTGNSATGGVGGRGGDGATLKGTENGGGRGGRGGTAEGGAVYVDNNSGSLFNFTGGILNSNNAAGGIGGDGGNRGQQPGGPYAGTPETGGDAGIGGDGLGGALYANRDAVLSTMTMNANSALGGAGGRGGSVPGALDFGTASRAGFGGAGGNGQGGAVYINREVQLRAGFLSGNFTASGAGGLAGTVASVANPPVAANGRADGGGVFTRSGLLAVNSTFTQNAANGPNGRGGAIASVDGNIQTTNVTIVANTASLSGGGIAAQGGVRIENTLVASNNAPTGRDAAGNFGDVVNSLFQNAGGITGVTHGTNGNLVGVDPLIGPLANNGGPTPTFALLIGSPALEAGSNDRAANRGLTTDQRGAAYPRVLDAADANTTKTVDIGAYEAGPMLPTLSDTGNYEDAPVLMTFDFGDAGQGVVASITSDRPSLFSTLSVNASSANSTGSVTAFPAPNQNGSANVTVTLTAANGRTISDTFVINFEATNDAPEFTTGPNITVDEDTGLQTRSGWATGIRPGPVTATDEAGQTYAFEATTAITSGNLIFLTEPTVSPTGELKFAAAANRFGTATVTLRLRDNGPQFPGVVNNPLSAPQTFTITVNPLNDAPTMEPITNRPAVLEDAAQQSVPLLGITPGLGEAQTLTFAATTDNPGLFTDLVVDYPGPGQSVTLRYKLVPNANGAGNITVTITDDGPTGPGEFNTVSRTFGASVTPVNDSPTMDAPANVADIEKDMGSQTIMLTGIGTGAANEIQNLSISAFSSNTAVAGDPTVSYTAGSDTATLTYTPRGTGQTSVTVIISDDGPGFAPNANVRTHTFTMGVVDTLAPVVTQVYVGGTGWAAPFRQFLATAGLGTAANGFAISGDAQLKSLPWTNLDQLAIRFNEAVSVQQEDLAVVGVRVPAYAVSAFAYDPATFTATWTLAGAIAADKLLLNLDATTAGAVADLSGNVLDGEWSNPLPATPAFDTFPSGNGTPGGDFGFRINVLPGDVNRSGGSVIGSDVTLVRNNQNFSPGSTGYSAFLDVNGSASILGSDVTAVRNLQGFSLPASDPIAPGGGGTGTMVTATGAIALMLPASSWTGFASLGSVSETRRLVELVL